MLLIIVTVQSVCLILFIVARLVLRACSFHTDPSGTFVTYEAKAIGSGSEGAQSSLQVTLALCMATGMHLQAKPRMISIMHAVPLLLCNARMYASALRLMLVMSLV